MAMMPRHEQGGGSGGTASAGQVRQRVYRELDALVTPIELTLVSVLQGVIMQILLPAAADLLHRDKAYLAIYALPSFLIMIAVWVSFILLSLTFVSWPIDVWHNLIYFLLTALESLAFAFLDKPVLWFVFVTLFCAISVLSFWYHWNFVKGRRRFYEARSAEDELLADAQRSLALDGKLTAGYMAVGGVAALALFLLNRQQPGADWHAWVDVGFAVAATPVAAMQVWRSFVLVRQRSKLVEVLMEARVRETAAG
ncbi:MAG: hypothetical protein ACYDCQ_04915 [Dehalococcoidia bacterium]